MEISRREFLTATAALVAIGPTAWRANHNAPHDALTMYGLIGKMTAVPGQRDALVAILIDGVANMPGCLSYIIATDPADADAIWITEVWDSQASHQASLGLPSVKNAIAKGRPLIAGFGSRTVTMPIGGQGLLNR
ncbi:MAG TPA: putative quinol monooxygenase [Gemmatimonadaceae bacterium]|jgi:quinol monooxygenase YgiN